MIRRRLPLRLARGVRRWLRDTRGVTATEFALIAPPFFALILGSLDIGQWVYAKVLINGAAAQAARANALETADTTAADAMVQSIVSPILPNVSISSTRRNYYDFADVDRPERWNDTNTDGNCNNSESYVDENGNGHWDADVARPGNGNASDVVVYQVTATYQSMFRNPFLPGSWGDRRVTATTVKKNQPFALQAAYTSATGTC